MLIGDGAIGNGAAWALSRVEISGLVRHVDPQCVDLGNLQRYVLAEYEDAGKRKTDVVTRYFTNTMRAEAFPMEFVEFVGTHGYRWKRFLLALDSARDRRAAQASLPEWIANAWTQPGDLGVSIHDFIEGACVSYLYLPDKALENEDAIIAHAFGVPDRLMEIRVLLHRGGGVPRSLLEAIALAHGLDLSRLLPFEGRAVRSLYVEGFCGGAVLPIGSAASPRQDVHVPLAHQSALAGILLAASGIEHALHGHQRGTRIRRANVLRPVAGTTAQPAAKDPRGICICQDADYRNVYTRKYQSQPSMLCAD